MNDMEKAQAIINGNHPASKIAEATNISRVTISHYRTGKTDITKGSWTVITKLARFFDAYGPKRYDKKIEL